ncbi:hypothetical protein KKC60_01025 [Patescibacteria group bacterium]|nr:hypothetical protein [Patescibacteria group bacterium]
MTRVVARRVKKDQEEFKDVSSFIEEANEKKGCFALYSEEPDLYFVALEESNSDAKEKILGAVAVKVGTFESLPVVAMFVQKSQFLQGRQFGVMAQVHRFVSTNSVISKVLLVHLYKYLRRSNISYAIFCSTRLFSSHLETLGIPKQKSHPSMAEWSYRVMTLIFSTLLILRVLRSRLR